MNQASLGDTAISLEVNIFFLKLRGSWCLERIHQRTYCCSDVFRLVIGSCVHLYFRVSLRTQEPKATVEILFKKTRQSSCEKFKP